MLEGQRSVVNQLYRRIVQDQRHQDVEVLLLEDITTRDFGQWSMARVLLSDRDPRVQMQHPDFDLYATPGRVLLARLAELIKSGHPIQTVVA